MKQLQIYSISSQKGFQIEESKNYFVSEFFDIQEAKEMMVAHLPDLLIYQINEIREIKAIHQFLNAFKQQIPTIILSDKLDKEQAVDLIHNGAIDFIDLNDFDAEKQINSTIVDIVTFICKRKEILAEKNQSSIHLKTVTLITFLIISSIIIALKFIH